MPVTIHTTDGPVTVYDNEIATLSLDFPGVDVTEQLRRFDTWVSSGKGQKPASQALTNSLKGWLRRAKLTPAKPEKPRFLSVEDALYECQRRGLVPEDFKPVGDSEPAQRASLKAMATCEWYRQNPEAEGEYAPPAQRPLWTDQPQE